MGVWVGVEAGCIGVGAGIAVDESIDEPGASVGPGDEVTVGGTGITPAMAKLGSGVWPTV